MRLIDADELIKILEEYENDEGSQAIYGAETLSLILGDCKIEIKNLSTAYDVDKVVKQLKELCDCEKSRAAEYDESGKLKLVDIYDAKAEAYSNAIKIVKSCKEELRHCLEDENCGDCQYHKPETKLVCKGLLQKAYERMEEQRKPLCELGDIVYDVVLCDDGEYHIFEMKVCDIDPFGDVRKGKVWNVYLEDDYTKAYRSFYEFGKTVFLTRQAAEKALAKMERNGMDEKIKQVLSQLHSVGGCGAQDDYSKGWDEAITEAIRIVEKETSIGIGEVLD